MQKVVLPARRVKSLTLFLQMILFRITDDGESQLYTVYLSGRFCGTDVGNRSGGCRDEIVVQRTLLSREKSGY